MRNRRRLVRASPDPQIIVDIHLKERTLMRAVGAILFVVFDLVCRAR